MYKIARFCFVLLYSLVGQLNSCHSAENIAIGKPYYFSKKPNYPLSAPVNDTTSLTDGKFTVGYFFTKEKTVGWKRSGSVEISIDLGKSYNIESIVFSTARRLEAGIDYPAHLAAFVGVEKNQLRYLGNLAEDPENIPGTYQTKKFKLSDISAYGRYVFLVIHPEGPHLFCDEIEVLEGDYDDGITGNLTIDKARETAEKLRRDSIDKKFIGNFIQELKANISQYPQLSSALLDIDQRLHAPKGLMDSSDNIEKELFRLRADLLRIRYSDKKFILSQVSPWAKVGSVHPDASKLVNSLPLVLPVHGYDYAAFWVTNIDTAPQEFRFKLNTPPPDIIKISVYQAPFVKSASMEQVPDPLLPLSGSVRLGPGESRLVFLACGGMKSGTWRGRLMVASDIYEVSVPLVCRVVKVTLPERLSLNSVNWNYLNFKPTRERKIEAMKDLFAHHMNVGVIHPSSLALVEQAGAMDFARMKQAFELQRGAEKVLIMMNYRDKSLRTAGNRFTFLSDPWKENFRWWYDRLVYIGEKAGFTHEQIYLYPYDEMGGEEIDQFIDLAKWARREIPSIKFYATLGKKGSERALPFLDIAQVINDYRLKNFDSSHSEMWIYNTKGPAKPLSPFSYYRLMAWQAFYGGYKGIGFWSYADTGWHSAPSSAWDDFDGKYPDFAVIYEGNENEIISSRRWEAWRLGIEDYELLKMYAKVKGEKAAKEQVELVLDHSDDPSLAREVRNRILIELSEDNSYF